MLLLVLLNPQNKIKVKNKNLNIHGVSNTKT